MTKVVVIGLIGAFLAGSLKKLNANISFVVAVITGVVIIGMLYLDVDGLVNVIKTVSSGYGISDGYIRLLLKVLGISYITQFAASAAEECGEKFIARKIEFAGRIFIASLSLPILVSLLNMIVSMI